MRSTPSIYREQVGGTAVTEHGVVVDVSGNPALEAHTMAHAVSPLILIGVFAALMVLTLTTVGVTYFDFGYKINLIVAIAIAVAKAMLVVAYFMHLRYDSPFYTLIVGLCLVFIAVFITFTIIDTANYAPILAPTAVTPA
ncbi:MAG: cytochrome C oxidase subunit IV family protein [Tepidisphaeraceae bacterium]